jgi:hypothetical protein
MQRRRLVHQECAQPVGGLAEPAAPVRLAHPRAPGRGEQPVDDLVEQVVLVAYVAIQRHRRHSEGGRQATHGQSFVALFGDDPQRRVNHLFAGDGAPRRPRGSGAAAAVAPDGGRFPTTHRVSVRHLRTYTHSASMGTRTHGSGGSGMEAIRCRRRCGRWCGCSSDC